MGQKGKTLNVGSVFDAATVLINHKLSIPTRENLLAAVSSELATSKYGEQQVLTWNRAMEQQGTSTLNFTNENACLILTDDDASLGTGGDQSNWIRNLTKLSATDFHSLVFAFGITKSAAIIKQNEAYDVLAKHVNIQSRNISLVLEGLGNAPESCTTEMVMRLTNQFDNTTTMSQQDAHDSVLDAILAFKAGTPWKQYVNDIQAAHSLYDKISKTRAQSSGGNYETERDTVNRTLSHVSTTSIQGQLPYSMMAAGLLTGTRDSETSFTFSFLLAAGEEISSRTSTMRSPFAARGTSAGMSSTDEDADKLRKEVNNITKLLTTVLSDTKRASNHQVSFASPSKDSPKVAKASESGPGAAKPITAKASYALKKDAARRVQLDSRESRSQTTVQPPSVQPPCEHCIKHETIFGRKTANYHTTEQCWHLHPELRPERRGSNSASFRGDGSNRTTSPRTEKAAHVQHTRSEQALERCIDSAEESEGSEYAEIAVLHSDSDDSSWDMETSTLLNGDHSPNHDRRDSYDCRDSMNIRVDYAIHSTESTTEMFNDDDFVKIPESPERRECTVVLVFPASESQAQHQYAMFTTSETTSVLDLQNDVARFLGHPNLVFEPHQDPDHLIGQLVSTDSDHSFMINICNDSVFNWV